MTKWIYSGDINLRYGGLFYRVNEYQYDYAPFVRVTPCSDAGLSDNIFWVETGTVCIPTRVETDRLDSVLSVIGETRESLKQYSRAIRRRVIIEACIAYGLYDIDVSDTVRIGPAEERFDCRDHDPVPTTILRSNASLRRYVRREYLA